MYIHVFACYNDPSKRIVISTKYRYSLPASNLAKEYLRSIGKEDLIAKLRIVETRELGEEILLTNIGE